LLAPTEGTIVPVNKRPKKPMTKGERAAMIFVILCAPVVLLILALDVKAIWFKDPMAVQQTHSSAVPPLVRAAVPSPEAARVSDSSSPVRSPAETSAEPSRTVDAAPAVTTTPSPTYVVGTSCTGHREGLREYDDARRLLVCTAGLWTFVQPAGDPPDAPGAAAPTPTPSPVRTTTSAPVTTAVPVETTATTAAPSTSTTGAPITTTPPAPDDTSVTSSPTG
jgi:hypothetical protein